MPHIRAKFKCQESDPDPYIDLARSKPVLSIRIQSLFGLWHSVIGIWMVNINFRLSNNDTIHK